MCVRKLLLIACRYFRKSERGQGEGEEDVTIETQEDTQLRNKNKLSASCGQGNTSISRAAEEEGRNKRVPQPGTPDGAATGNRNQDRLPHRKGQRKAVLP